jgi:hypothetical protein
MPAVKLKIPTLEQNRWLWPAARSLHGEICTLWRTTVIYNRYKSVIVSLLKRLLNGRFTLETAT